MLRVISTSRDQTLYMINTTSLEQEGGKVGVLRLLYVLLHVFWSYRAKLTKAGVGVGRWKLVLIQCTVNDV